MSLRDVKESATGKFLREVPDKLEPLLTLVNLLPPRWSRVLVREYPHLQLDYIYSETELLSPHWKPAETMEQRLSQWLSFSKAIAILPSPLQAFILKDRDGEVVEFNGHREPLSDPFPPPSDDNFAVLKMNDRELKQVVRTAFKRYKIAFDLEKKAPSQLAGNRLGGGREFRFGTVAYQHTYSNVLLRRARQRWIYLLAAEETLMCLTCDNVDEQLERRRISNLYEGQSILRISREGKDKGKVAKFDALARFLFDVEFFDYERAKKTKRGSRPNRIRICPVCHQIFWAGRLDAGQCGNKKCKSALSSRLSRRPEVRALYNRARRKKRAQLKIRQATKKRK